MDDLLCYGVTQLPQELAPEGERSCNGRKHRIFRKNCSTCSIFTSTARSAAAHFWTARRNLLLAGSDLNAAVPFYGTQPSAADAARIKAPLLAHYASLDTRITSGWPAFDAELTAAHVTHEGYVYEGANHGFHNDTTPRYDEAAATLAWQRTMAWFNKYLMS
jgi:dienelactone hydrolase